MQERHLYEYAVIRFVPKVEREEFINMGIVLFSKQAKYLKSLYTIDENKLKLFSSELDINCLKEGLQVLETDCPYLAPVPYRGKRNSSLYLPYVAEEIAALKGAAAEDVVLQTEENARKLYGL